MSFPQLIFLGNLNILLNVLNIGRCMLHQPDDPHRPAYGTYMENYEKVLRKESIVKLLT